VAKKRVHEIAKERGLTSKEVLAALNAAGVGVKAAASSVEEDVVAKALSSAGGAELPPVKLAKRQPAPAPEQKPAEPEAEAAPEKVVHKPHPQKIGPPPPTEPAKAPQAPPAAPVKPVSPAGSTPAAGGSNGGGAAGKKRRRVVIDSQASRREHGGPPPPQRPPRRRGGRRRRPLLEEPVDRGPVEEVEPEAVKIASGATVREVAETLSVSSADVIKKLMGLGEMATLTQTLTDDTIMTLGDELGHKVEVVSAAEEVVEEPAYEDTAAELKGRPPVVTIMGHVDHGKTSLLDAIRQTEVVAGEAGGITQHIGAYQVHHGEKTISFIDTPGHAAFTAMRARGADVTDIVVVVVAADDGVMPQTVEAIDHARAADVPMIVAINKIDVEGANPDKVKGELAQQGLNPEDWGGDTIFSNVSAKTQEGLEDLLENILLVAEVEELKANPDAPASGAVIEAHLDPGRGPVATVLVQRGTLKIGDSIVAGSQWGKVKAMQDFTGTRLQTAGPGDPVEVLGLDGVGEAGERVEVVENDRKARQIAGERAHRLKTEALARRSGRKMSLDEVFARAQEGVIKELNMVLKADVSGSLEALEDEIAKVPQQQVRINIIRAAAGGINESDVMLASASDAVIIGFNVRPLADARRAADSEGIEIRTYSVIYKVTEELRAAMEGMLEAVEVENTLGSAEVKQTFKASRVGMIAGCEVTEGRVTRDAEVRLVREGTVVWTGKLGSLRRFSDDVREVEAGQECGIVLDGYADLKVGDVLEVFETKQVEQKLDQ
jgi:translation initiation factor IF-2